MATARIAPIQPIVMNNVSGSHLRASVSTSRSWAHCFAAAPHFGKWSNAEIVKATPAMVKNHSVPQIAHPTPLLYRNTRQIGVKVPGQGASS